MSVVIDAVNQFSSPMSAIDEQEAGDFHTEYKRTNSVKTRKLLGEASIDFEESFSCRQTLIGSAYVRNNAKSMVSAGLLINAPEKSNHNMVIRNYQKPEQELVTR